MKSSSRKRLTVAAAAAQTSIRRAASSSPGSRNCTGRRVATATAPRGTPRLRREKRPARTPPPRRGGGPRFLPAPITHAGKAGTRPSREEQIGNAWGALQGAGRSEPSGEASARPARRLRLLRRVPRPGAQRDPLAGPGLLRQLGTPPGAPADGGRQRAGVGDLCRTAPNLGHGYPSPARPGALTADGERGKIFTPSPSYWTISWARRLSREVDTYRAEAVFG